MTPIRSSPSASPGSLVVLVLLFLLGGLAPVEAAAQSIFSTGGLGVPVHARDARTRALGGIRVGLRGPALFPGDPGTTLDLRLPVLAATYQATSGSFDEPGGSGDLEGARFPFIGVAYPFRGWGMLSLTFEALLDQRWMVERDEILVIDDDFVPVVDGFQSDGGISAIRLGWNHRLSDELAVIVSVGAYTGESERTFRRIFPEGVEEAPVAPFERRSRWSYSGPTAEVGAAWDVTEFVRVGGRLTWSGTLTADPDEDTPGGDREFDLPLQVDLGLSGILTSRVVGAVGMRYADWSDAAAGLDEGGSPGGTWEIGGGVEWAGPSLVGREFPIRLGYRRADLPFTVEGAAADESAFSLGVGAALTRVDEDPLARFDLSLERGSREGGAVEEDFWTATLSLRLSTP